MEPQTEYLRPALPNSPQYSTVQTLWTTQFICHTAAGLKGITTLFYLFFLWCKVTQSTFVGISKKYWNWMSIKIIHNNQETEWEIWQKYFFVLRISLCNPASGYYVYFFILGCLHSDTVTQFWAGLYTGSSFRQNVTHIKTLNASRSGLIKANSLLCADPVSSRVFPE